MSVTTKNPSVLLDSVNSTVSELNDIRACLDNKLAMLTQNAMLYRESIVNNLIERAEQYQANDRNAFDDIKALRIMSLGYNGTICVVNNGALGLAESNYLTINEKGLDAIILIEDKEMAKAFALLDVITEECDEVETIIENMKEVAEALEEAVLLSRTYNVCEFALDKEHVDVLLSAVKFIDAAI